MIYVYICIILFFENFTHEYFIHVPTAFASFLPNLWPLQMLLFHRCVDIYRHTHACATYSIYFMLPIRTWVQGWSLGPGNCKGAGGSWVSFFQEPLTTRSSSRNVRPFGIYPIHVRTEAGIAKLLNRDNYGWENRGRMPLWILRRGDLVQMKPTLLIALPGQQVWTSMALRRCSFWPIPLGYQFAHCCCDRTLRPKATCGGKGEFGLYSSSKSVTAGR